MQARPTSLTREEEQINQLFTHLGISADSNEFKDNDLRAAARRLVAEAVTNIERQDVYNALLENMLANIKQKLKAEGKTELAGFALEQLSNKYRILLGAIANEMANNKRDAIDEGTLKALFEDNTPHAKLLLGACPLIDTENNTYKFKVNLRQPLQDYFCKKFIRKTSEELPTEQIAPTQIPSTTTNKSPSTTAAINKHLGAENIPNPNPTISFIADENLRKMTQKLSNNGWRIQPKTQANQDHLIVANMANNTQEFKLESHRISTTDTSAQRIETYKAMLIAYKAVMKSHPITITSQDAANKALWEQAMQAVYPKDDKRPKLTFNLKGSQPKPTETTQTKPEQTAPSHHPVPGAAPQPAAMPTASPQPVPTDASQTPEAKPPAHEGTTEIRAASPRPR